MQLPIDADFPIQRSRMYDYEKLTITDSKHAIHYCCRDLMDAIGIGYHVVVGDDGKTIENIVFDGAADGHPSTVKYKQNCPFCESPVSKIKIDPTKRF